MKVYREWKIERVAGSSLGRRGSAARRFGYLATEPDGQVHAFPPNAHGGLTLSFVKKLVDAMIATAEKYRPKDGASPAVRA